MATLTVRNLDDDVKVRLRKRAAEHGHSLEAEVRKTLRDSVVFEGRPKTGEELLRRIRARFEGLGDFELDTPPRAPVREPPDFT